MTPFDAGVGYAICIIDFYMGMYYNTIIGWAVYYFVASFTSELPWTSCDHPWNTNSCALVGPVDNGTFVRSPAQEYFEYDYFTRTEFSKNVLIYQFKDVIIPDY